MIAPSSFSSHCGKRSALLFIVFQLALLLDVSLSNCNNIKIGGFVAAFQSAYVIMERNRSRKPGFASSSCFSSELFMVSQKEKKRLREDAKRRKALQEVQTEWARNKLVWQLQEVQKANENKRVSSTKTLLNRALRDNGDDFDIGMEASLSVLNIFYTVKSPCDVSEYLSNYLPKKRRSSSTTQETITEDENLLLSQFGLWAHAMLKDWETALTYAEALYLSTSNDDERQQTDDIVEFYTSRPSNSTFSTRNRQSILLNFAIQAFANTGQNIQRAMNLTYALVGSSHYHTSSEGESVVIPSGPALKLATVNAILNYHVRNRKLQDAKNFFHEIQEIQERRVSSSNSSDSATTLLLNKDSYSLLLDCAAQWGNVALMEQALGGMGSIQQELQRAIDPGTKGMGSSMKSMQESLKGLSAKHVLMRILEVFAKAPAVSGVPLSMEQLTLASQLIQLLKSGKGDVSIDPKLLSRILVTLEEDFLVANVVQSLGRNHKEPLWFMPLSVPAKTRILPIQHSFEVQRGYKSGGAAWKILNSLVKINKNDGSVSQESRNFLRKQSPGFCYAAWKLSRDEGQQKLMGAIIENCWYTLLLNQNGEGLSFKKAGLVITSSMSLPNESLKLELFEKITNTLRQSPVFSSSFDDKEVESYPSFANNAKLDLIVRQACWLLRASARAASSISDEDSAKVLKDFAPTLCYAAMWLASELEEFSFEYVLDHGPTDNGAKEAVQTIMKELLQSNLLENDDDLVWPAYSYFYSLAKVSASSSVISYEDLFFPLSLQALLLNPEDPFQDFRDCVLHGEIRQKKLTGNRILDAALRLLFSGLGDDGYVGEFQPLLPTLICMAQISDQRTGRTTYDDFISEYKSFFLSWRKDLILDQQLFSGLCLALSSSATMTSKLKEALPIPTNRWWFHHLWSPDMAKSVIEEKIAWKSSQRDGIGHKLRNTDSNQMVPLSGRDWIENKLRNTNSNQMVPLSARYLVNLYAQAGMFYEIMDENNSKPLGEEYIKACRFTSAHLVNICLSNVGVEGKKTASGRRGRPSKPDFNHWQSSLVAMLIELSKAVTCYDENDDSITLPNGTSSYSKLVEHVLNSFSYCLPATQLDSDDIFRGLLDAVVSHNVLHPSIKSAVDEWYYLNLEGGEE